MADVDRFQRLAALWTKAHPVVAGFIHSGVNDFSTAEDLLQEVATTVVAKFDQFDESHSFNAWAIGVAKLVLLDHFRRSARAPKMIEALDELELAFQSIEPEADVRRQFLRDCLKRIKGRALDVIARRYTDGKSPAEIAGALHLSVSNVLVILHRTREILRRCIEEKMNQQEVFES